MDLTLWVDDPLELGLGGSEHQLDGVELRGIGWEGQSHPASIRAEVLYKTTRVDGSVIKDEDDATSIVLEGSLRGEHFPVAIVVSQEVFHFDEEFHKALLSVSPTSELTHIHTLVCQGTYGIGLV